MKFQIFKESAQRDYMRTVVSNVWEHYENRLKKEKALDFDDLLLKTMLLLRDNEAVRERYQKTWQYVHIDEYQDTNEVQYRIARLLSDSHRNICVVGDIDQMIYSWRGADIENILNFESDYPDAKIVVLAKLPFNKNNFGSRQ
jgi:DNA helicase-2/ATP-dependent DNA helicase PcrA